MATYKWTIEKLHTKNITEGGKTYTDVILRVAATLTGTSETIGSINGQSQFDLDMNVSGLSSGFTEYDSVTEANVISWVEGRVGSEQLSNCKAEIEDHIAFNEKVHGAVAKEDSEGNSTFPW